MKSTEELTYFDDTKVRDWLIGSAAIYIVLVFNLLEPFGINIQSFVLVYHLALSSYGIVSALTLVFILKWLWPYLANKWPEIRTVRPSLFLTLIVVMLSLSNWLYSQLLHHTISGWHNMYVPIRSFSQLMPQFLSIYALWGLVCWGNYRFFFVKQVSVVAAHEACAVTLYSDNQSDHFRVDLKKLVCCQTCDNYIQIYYLNEQSELKKRMLRLSMKKLEAQLQTYQQFFRSHQSFFVNLTFVKGLKKVQANQYLEVAYIDFDVAISKKNVKDVKSLLAA